MIRQIELKRQLIEYTLNISRRARRLRLTVYGDGRLVVSAPRYLNEKVITKFITSKADWILKRQEYFKRFPSRIFGSGTKKDFAENKERALAFVKEKISYYNQAYTFKVGRISVRNQKTRWGSCSKKGNLSFNYKIINLPAHLAGYLIVHELCHLKEFNHSRRFWDLVAETFPDYSKLRKELKNGQGKVELKTRREIKK